MGNLISVNAKPIKLNGWGRLMSQDSGGATIVSVAFPIFFLFDVTCANRSKCMFTYQISLFGVRTGDDDRRVFQLRVTGVKKKGGGASPCRREARIIRRQRDVEIRSDNNNKRDVEFEMERAPIAGAVVL